MSESSRDPPLPLHERIRRDVEAKIMLGQWKPGDRIPYEHELMTAYGCARMTVNKALSALSQAGLVERRKRAGTFVAAPRFDRAALEIPDIRSEVLGQGKSYRVEIQSLRKGQAAASDLALLAAGEADVLTLDCRHFADERPYALEHRIINLEAVPEASAADFSQDPPGSWLLRHVAWTEAEHRITAINASPAIARALGVGEGEACLALERWTWRSSERITYARLIYPGQTYGLVAHFTSG